MNKTIKIGMIGTGVSLRIHLPAFRQIPNAEVVAICGSTQTRAEEFAKKNDIPMAFGNYQELCHLKDIDLVTVATPNNFHYKVISYALKQGKHILAEKPLALNMKEIKSLSNKAKYYSTFAIIDHQLRFNPYFQKVRDLIKSGNLGRLYFIRIHYQSIGFSNREAPWTWSFDENMGGGVRLAFATHLVDLLWFWVGFRKVFYVSSAMDVVVPERRDQAGKVRNICASSFFSAEIALDSCLTVQLSATTAAVGEPRFDLSMFGTHGELHFDLANKLTGCFLGKQGGLKSIPVDGILLEELENRTSIFISSFSYFAAKIIEAIMLNDRTVISDATTFEQAIPTQEVLKAILNSSIEGKCTQLHRGYTPGAYF